MLLQYARQKVVENGYFFKKGKSRSLLSESAEPASKRSKRTDQVVRTETLQRLESELKITNQRINIKEKQCEQGAAVKNYKLCNDLLEEINSLTKEKHETQAEISVLKRKNKKSNWYMKHKQRSFSISSNDSSNMACSEASSSFDSVPFNVSDESCDAYTQLPIPVSESTPTSLPQPQENSQFSIPVISLKPPTSLPQHEHFQSGLPAFSQQGGQNLKL